MKTPDTDFFGRGYPRQAPPNPTDFAQFCAERRARQHLVANLFVPEPQEIEPVQDLRQTWLGMFWACAVGVVIFGVGVAALVRWLR